MKKNAFTLMRAVFITIIVGSHACLIPSMDKTRGDLAASAVIGFFALAGFFSWKGLHEKTYPEFAIDKIKRLYVPLVCVAAFSFFLIPVLLNLLFFDPASSYIVLNTKIDMGAQFQEFILLILYTNTTHLWFIYALLVIFLAFPFFLKLFSKIGNAASLLMLFLITVLVGFYHSTEPPFYCIILEYLFFFYAGYLVREKEIKLAEMAAIGGPIALAFFIMGIASLTILEDPVISSMVLALGACAGVFAAYWACLSAERLLKGWGSAVLDAAYCIGENSYAIYLLHQPYLHLRFASSKAASLWPGLVVLWSLLSTAAGIVLPIMLVNLLKRFRGMLRARHHPA